MVPDPDLQLQTVLKALGDNVQPAVDPEDKVAVEQLALVMATLKMVRDQLPLYRRFIRRLLEDEIALAENVGAALGTAAQFSDAVAAGRAALADPELDAGELEAIRQSLTTRTVEAIAAAGRTAAGLAALTPVLLRGTQPSLERLRAWCVPSGFEPYAGQIPGIDTLI